jgi:hypothetical protein
MRLSLRVFSVDQYNFISKNIFSLYEIEIL